MKRSTVALIVSRVLYVAGGVGVLVFGYWFVQTALAPVDVPPPMPSPKSVTFDQRLDISKSDTFNRLRPLGPTDTAPLELGRQNPFIPAAPPTRISVTSTQPSSTSTLMNVATTTTPAPTSTVPAY